MKVKIQQLDVPNKNNRIYPARTIEEALQRLNGKPVIGHIGVDGGNDPSTFASHQITNLAIEDGYLVGQITILDTEAGKTARRLLEGPLRGDVRSQGYGDVSPDGIITNYTIVSIDIVSNGA